MDLSVKKSFYWSFIESFVSLGIQFISLVILSRILSPEDYGIMGIIAIFIAISNMIVDSGMGASLIKKTDVTKTDYSTLFWYNIVVSFLIYFLIYLFSSKIAHFYDIDELKFFIRIIGITIVVNSIGLVQNIQLIRNLKFKNLAIITITANGAATLVAILFSIAGYGIWALIVQQLVLSIVKTFGLLLNNRFLPSFKLSLKSFKEQFSFGIHLLLSSLLKTVYDNIYSSVLGKYTTPIFTGYYLQANKIQNIPVNLATTIIDRAMFPVLSRIEDNSCFKQEVKSLSKKVLFVVIPVMLLSCASSFYIVDLLLGDKWIKSAWILSVLCVSGIALCGQALNRNVLKSLGATKKIFCIEILKIILGISILLVTIFVGSYYVILGILLSSVLSLIISEYILSNEMDYSIKEQINDLFKCFCPYLVPFIGVWLFNYFFLLPSVIGFISNMVLFIACLILIVFLFDLGDTKRFLLSVFKYLQYGVKKCFSNN